tara:strand:- start:23 stop:691 length:669 start_codon:yes stop_codon:yes gene_type:complete
MSENTPVNDDTDTSINNIQATEKTYTQREVDDMMARTKSAVQRKIASKYDDLGDPEELRQLKADNESRKLEESKKRGEFDKIIQELAAKKDEEIKKRDDIIRSYTVDMPLIDTAARLGAVNPKQVQALLKPNLRLGETGEVEVLDEKGTVRYSDKGTPFRVEDLVKEFLDNSPHFKAAGPSTTQTRTNVNQKTEKFDIKNLNMSNPEDRKLYAQYRKANGLA